MGLALGRLPPFIGVPTRRRIPLPWVVPTSSGIVVFSLFNVALYIIGLSYPCKFGLVLFVDIRMVRLDQSIVFLFNFFLGCISINP
jgi:hypothetical protein